MLARAKGKRFAPRLRAPLDPHCARWLTGRRRAAGRPIQKSTAPAGGVDHGASPQRVDSGPFTTLLGKSSRTRVAKKRRVVFLGGFAGSPF
jgi:hypothetical protein